MAGTTRKTNASLTNSKGERREKSDLAIYGHRLAINNWAMVSIIFSKKGITPFPEAKCIRTQGYPEGHQPDPDWRRYLLHLYPTVARSADHHLHA